MTTKRKVTIGISLAAGALLGILLLMVLLEALIGPRGVLSGFDRGIHARYERITVGEARQAVIDALGAPNAKSDEFNLPQRHGFEHLFDAAERSSSVEYYQWINGTNWFYCIGFDSAGIVVIKGEGHS
jgi:hypothetical protein